MKLNRLQELAGIQLNETSESATKKQIALSVAEFVKGQYLTAFDDPSMMEDLEDENEDAFEYFVNNHVKLGRDPKFHALVADAVSKLIKSAKY